MDYEKIIKAIDREYNYTYHFTNYDFGEILKIKCPRPENSPFLKDEYFSLMNELKEFLKTKPTKEMLELFIMNSVKLLDSSKYLKEEFELLILKYNGFNYFLLGVGTAKEYFDKHRNEINYATQER